METATHNHIQIMETGWESYIPKELAHCDRREYNEVCYLIYEWQTGQIDYVDFRIHAVTKILKLKKGKRKINTLEMEFMHANIFAISELMDSFFTKSKEGMLIKQNFTHNHNPDVRPLFKKYYGPQSEFSNVTFGQYEDGLNLYHMYAKTKDEKFLYMLMATFYLPKKKPYIASKIEKLAEDFALLDFGVVYGFFLFFGSFQIYLTDSMVTWEGQTIDLSILYKPTSRKSKVQSDIPGLGIKSLAYQLAESGVFGDLKTLRTENLWEVLLRLYDLRKRDLDAIAEQDALKNEKP
ncbi:MAG TPA: hypothetical protein VLY84_00290 [Dysgonamonadaceae bacterium]|nr:hypothetical protein [Dysgonamonadaceae bacterium]